MPDRFHLPRLVAAFALCGSLFALVAGSAFAQAAPAIPPAPSPTISVAGVSASDVSGQPSTDDSSPVGYYLWHDDNGFHLRTHGPGAEHRFEARLVTTGTFKDVDRTMLEQDDHLAVENGGHVLVVRFHTFDGWDGINFHIDGGEYLRLNLKLDGQDISTDNIFLGPGRSNPPTNPFRIEI